MLNVNRLRHARLYWKQLKNQSDSFSQTFQNQGKLTGFKDFAKFIIIIQIRSYNENKLS